jgi:hypothetical protein
LIPLGLPSWHTPCFVAGDAAGEAPSGLVATNQKYTVGVYHSLTENFTLLAEFTDT